MILEDQKLNTTSNSTPNSLKFTLLITVIILLLVAVISIILYHSYLLSVFPTQTTLYEDDFFQGASYNITMFYRLGTFVRCFDLPSNWYDRASSINTSGNCVYLWTLPGCSGNHLHVAPGTPSHYSFSEVIGHPFIRHTTFGLSDCINAGVISVTHII